METKTEENWDRWKRDKWLSDMKKCKVGESVMVGNNTTLADVVRWLDLAILAQTKK